MLLYFIPAIIILFLSLWLVTFVYTSFRGSPYVPLKKTRLQDITQFIKQGDRVADLGCGDGRVLIQAIKHGAALAHGWESDFLVYLIGLWKIKKSGQESQIKIHFGDFWHADLSDFNLIYVYQMTKYMGDFKNKLLPQLKKGTLIISPDYKIPGLKIHQKVRDSARGIFIYKI